ncbi:MAG: hypothetical protein LQ342_001405 [Letrouitia transgressa]|nr:MAG: hypothetical protein LQ342_001405 [Letrouitia transgressa]
MSQDLARFGKMVKLMSFAPFQGAPQALENANQVAEGIASEFLISVLETNLPNLGKKHKVTLGVADRNLAVSIKAAFPGLECETGDTSEIVQDMLRGIREHAPKLLKQLQEGDVERAALGLGHAYSRARVKFSVQRNDNHIIQAIATLDHLDKTINTFAMRVREWYSWHFPELLRIVSDNYQYSKLALFIGDKRRLSDSHLDDVAAQVNKDVEIAKNIIKTAKISMGQEITKSDMENVQAFASNVVKLTEYRKSLYSYLVAKMDVVAPNLATLIGEVVGARLISSAGSLTNLSKYPASTIQILGAEKALFRALKTKGNTPKYGLIYHSAFIGRAGQRVKGRISRFLANKCSIASRIDNFSDAPNKSYGNALKKQVEERLAFYDTGAVPMKNEVAMRNVMDKLLEDVNVDTSMKEPTDQMETGDLAPEAMQKQKKKAKKEKAEKSKKHHEGKRDDQDIEDVLEAQPEDTIVPPEKKKRKHSKLDGGGSSKKVKS